MKSLAATAVCLALAGVVTAGCGKATRVVTPEGEVTVEHHPGGGATATVTTEEGTATGEVGAHVTEADLGVPLYPGAAVEHSVTWSAEGQQEGRLSQVRLVTPDSPEAVKAFYQQRLPKAQVALDMSTAELQMVQMLYEEGAVKRQLVITREKDADRTSIVISRVEDTE